MNTVAAIVLAAGESARFGQPKQLARFEGKTLIRRACETALDSGARPVIVVLGAHAGGCEEEVRDLPVVIARNTAWQSGMASSIRAGLDTLSVCESPIGAVLLCLCDQPHLTGGALREIIAAHHSSGAKIVASEHDGVLGPPALFHSDYFPLLRALRGDEGARSLFRQFAEELATIPLPPAALDVDTPEDLERLVTTDRLSV